MIKNVIQLYWKRKYVQVFDNTMTHASIMSEKKQNNQIEINHGQDSFLFFQSIFVASMIMNGSMGEFQDTFAEVLNWHKGNTGIDDWNS